MPTFTDSYLEDVLNAVINRIISEVDGFTDASCYIHADPDHEPQPQPGEFVCVLVPGNGTFEEGMIDGGGEKQATLVMLPRIKLYGFAQLDEAGHDGIFFTDEARGVMHKWTEILAAVMTPWMPQDDSGNILTRDPLIPASVIFQHKDRRIGDIDTTLKLVFDLNLTS